MTTLRPFATAPHATLPPTATRSAASPPYSRYRYQNSSPLAYSARPVAKRLPSRPTAVRRPACRCYCCLSGLPILTRTELASSIMKQGDATIAPVLNSRAEFSSSASSEEKRGSGVRLQSNGTVNNTGSGHRCLWDLLHVMCGMRLLVFVGLLSIVGILSLEAMYFRRAIFVLLIPTMVTACTMVSIARRSHHLVWPIVGISFFHMFLAAYLLLIFGFYFFFKPLYIIMVLNWAFDTLHTQKTLSFYLYSLAIASFLALFLLFNLWQLVVSLRYRDYLHYRRLQQEQPGSSSSSLSAVGACSSASSASLIDNNGTLGVDQQQGGAELGMTPRQTRQQHQPPYSVTIGAANGSGGLGTRTGGRGGYMM